MRDPKVPEAILLDYVSNLKKKQKKNRSQGALCEAVSKSRSLFILGSTKYRVTSYINIAGFEKDITIKNKGYDYF